MGLLILCASAWGYGDLIARWSLNQTNYNGNYLDSVAGYIAEPNGEPNFITGVRDEPNGAIMITSPSGWGLSQIFKGDLSTNGFTICLWNKWNGNWQGTIDVNDLVVESTGSATKYTVIDGIKADQRWHNVCITYDNNSVRLYLNGQLKLSQAGKLPAGREAVIEIGNSLRQQIFNGDIDDIRLYNYPLNQTEITQLVTANINCILEYASIYDVSGPFGVPDCIIDSYDLAGFAVKWLENCTPEYSLEYDFSGPSGIPDYTVNFYDFAVFSSHWLESGW